MVAYTRNDEDANDARDLALKEHSDVEEKLYMHSGPQYKSQEIEIYEFPNLGCCEIYYADTDHSISITKKEDAEAVIESLKRFVITCKT